MAWFLSRLLRLIKSGLIITTLPRACFPTDSLSPAHRPLLAEPLPHCHIPCQCWIMGLLAVVHFAAQSPSSSQSPSNSWIWCHCLVRPCRFLLSEPGNPPFLSFSAATTMVLSFTCLCSPCTLDNALCTPLCSSRASFSDLHIFSSTPSCPSPEQHSSAFADWNLSCIWALGPTQLAQEIDQLFPIFSHLTNHGS